MTRPARNTSGPGRIRGSGTLRIIGGQWRRRTLAIAPVEGLRPTPDRVRETLFNWLGQYLDGLHCLDLFAGSGALGLEAASRGAAQVTLVENDPTAMRQLQAHCETLAAGRTVRLLSGDALHFLRDAQPEHAFDVVFLDPPYRLDLLPRCLDAVPRLLAADARVYVEDAAPLAPPAGWEVLREDRAGQVFYGLLKCSHPASASSIPAPSIR